MSSVQSNLDQPLYFSIPPPVAARIAVAVAVAVAVVVWGARTDRPWTVAVAATLGLPILWPHGLTVLLAAIPFLRRGDRSASLPEWRTALNSRRLAVSLTLIVGAAVIFALLAPQIVRTLMDGACSGLQPYER